MAVSLSSTGGVQLYILRLHLPMGTSPWSARPTTPVFKNRPALTAQCRTRTLAERWSSEDRSIPIQLVLAATSAVVPWHGWFDHQLCLTGTEIGARGSWCINPELTRRLALATFGSLPWSGSEGKQASPLCLCSPKRWSIRCLPRSSPPSRGPGMTTNLVGLLRCTQAIPAPGSLFLSAVIRVVFTSGA